MWRKRQTEETAFSCRLSVFCERFTGILLKQDCKILWFALEFRQEDQTVNYTYIVKCIDGSLYTGWTNDLEKRLRAHNAGKGAKYTKSRRPVELVYCEEFVTKEEAMSREWAIKRKTREEKMKMIRESHC